MSFRSGLLWGEVDSYIGSMSVEDEGQGYFSFDINMLSGFGLLQGGVEPHGLLSIQGETCHKST